MPHSPAMFHSSCRAAPAILYFGTPVVLIGTRNPDGSANLAPFSSVFWLGWRAVVGLGVASQTAANLERTGAAVLNLPSEEQAAAVDRLALTTAANPVPPYKQARGYRHAADKFALAGLTELAGETTCAPRAAECPVQMETERVSRRGLAEGEAGLEGRVAAFELAVRRVHLAESILVPGERDRVDPLRWRPLMMSFQHYFGLTAREVHPSRLARIPEHLYAPSAGRGAG